MEAEIDIHWRFLPANSKWWRWYIALIVLFTMSLFATLFIESANPPAAFIAYISGPAVLILSLIDRASHGRPR